VSQLRFQQALDQASLDIDRKVSVDVARLLQNSRLTISVAESLTGGLIGARLSQLSGSSTYFLGGVICYTPLLKIKLCGVKASTLHNNGIVSEAVAMEMAEGMCRLTGSNIAISTTGIAGPNGDTISQVDVGTVFIGFSFCGDLRVKRFQFTGNRTQVRTQSVYAALGYLRNWLQQRSPIGD
jgi:nicotinamide-nucleotide amidase